MTRASTRSITYVYPKLTRAGLGNELFPYVRAVERAAAENRVLVPPRWFRLRVGPYLRGERDRREYWRLFRPPTISERWLRMRVETRLAFRSLFSRGDSPRLLVLAGMGAFFRDFTHDGEWVRGHLIGAARPGVISEPLGRPYVSVHIRLGDFTRPASDEGVLLENNQATPLDWYLGPIEALQKRFPELRVVISSDGTDEELRQLLRLPNVLRSPALNALDELMILSNSAGMLGSRSTFTGWGAFLGAVPLLVIVGGNSYLPHDMVWESGMRETPSAWLDLVEHRIVSSLAE